MNKLTLKQETFALALMAFHHLDTYIGPSRAQERRWRLKALLKKYATQDKKAYLEESGMDCDCVRYTGQVHCIRATLGAYTRLLDGIEDGAEGGFNLWFITEEEAKVTQYSSRDLIMEATEDGHPHVVYG